MICRHTGATIVHMVGVKDKAFLPKNHTNRCVTPRVVELGAIAFGTILQDMLNVKKATHRYLSCFGLK